MILNIEIIDVTSTTRPGKTGTYTMLEVTYRDVAKGETKTKKMADFALPAPLASNLKTAEKGDKFAIIMEKEGDYWNWKGVAGEGTPIATASKAGATASSAPAAKSSYETSDERAARQRLIVRQSSLTAALSYFNSQPSVKVTVGDIMSLADEFCNFVFETPMVTSVAAKPKLAKVSKQDTDDFIDDDLPI